MKSQCLMLRCHSISSKSAFFHPHASPSQRLMLLSLKKGILSFPRGSPLNQVTGGPHPPSASPPKTLVDRLAVPSRPPLAATDWWCNVPILRNMGLSENVGYIPNEIAI